MTAPDHAGADGRRARLVSPSGRVAVTYPTASFPYFRLSWTDTVSLRRVQTTAGRTLEGALSRAQNLERRLGSSSPEAARANVVGDLLDAFMDPRRPMVRRKDGAARPWSDGYRAAMRKRTEVIRSRLGSIPLSALDQARVAAVVNAQNTYGQAEKLRVAFSSIVSFGVEKRILDPDQIDVAKVDVVVAPGQRVRRPTAAPLTEGEHTDLLDESSIPTVKAYRDFRCGLRGRANAYPHFEGLAETLAFCGPRIHEAFALTADDVAPPTGELVLPRLAIERQVIELSGGGHRLTRPKNGYRRQVLVIGVTPTGFALAEWLLGRAAEARIERAEGSNPRALLFPAPRGGYWWLTNFRRSVFNPAAEAAGWPSTTVTTTSTWVEGGVRVTRDVEHRLWDHTIHSARHLFATTAINEWGWRDDVLCNAGGWHSEQFVRQHYYARTPALLVAAQRGQLTAMESRAGTAPLDATSVSRLEAHGRAPEQADVVTETPSAPLSPTSSEAAVHPGSPDDLGVGATAGPCSGTSPTRPDPTADSGSPTAESRFGDRS